MGAAAVQPVDLTSYICTKDCTGSFLLRLQISSEQDGLRRKGRSTPPSHPASILLCLRGLIASSDGAFAMLTPCSGLLRPWCRPEPPPNWPKSALTATCRCKGLHRCRHGCRFHPSWTDFVGRVAARSRATRIDSIVLSHLEYISRAV